MPIGNSSDVNPQGIASEGSPDKLIGAINISDKYIFRGSLTFSPILKGGVGETGEIITSTPPKAFSKSLIINVLTLAAFS